MDERWRKSTLSGNSGCVEVARVGGRLLVRDSKNPASPGLAFTQHEWRAFIAGAKAGEFDIEETA